MSQRDIGGVSSLRNENTSEPDGVVARIESVPAPPEIDLHPGRKVHRRIGRRNPDIAHIARAITGWDVETSAECNGKVCEVPANAAALCIGFCRRAGGAGIPAFFTRTGAGTDIAKGKEEREFDGERYIMERGIVADLSIVHAWMGDHEGNLVYRKTARNFNPMMASAGKVTVAEVEHLVRPGEINPDHIITPGVYVQRIVHVPNAVKHIEQRTVRKRHAAPAGTGEEV